MNQWNNYESWNYPQQQGYGYQPSSYSGAAPGYSNRSRPSHPNGKLQQKLQKGYDYTKSQYADNGLNTDYYSNNYKDMYANNSRHYKDGNSNGNGNYKDNGNYKGHKDNGNYKGPSGGGNYKNARSRRGGQKPDDSGSAGVSDDAVVRIHNWDSTSLPPDSYILTSKEFDLFPSTMLIDIYNRTQKMQKADFRREGRKGYLRRLLKVAREEACRTNVSTTTSCLATMGRMNGDMIKTTTATKWSASANSDDKNATGNIPDRACQAQTDQPMADMSPAASPVMPSNGTDLPLVNSMKSDTTGTGKNFETPKLGSTKSVNLDSFSNSQDLVSLETGCGDLDTTQKSVNAPDGTQKSVNDIQNVPDLGITSVSPGRTGLLFAVSSTSHGREPTTSLDGANPSTDCESNLNMDNSANLHASSTTVGSSATTMLASAALMTEVSPKKKSLTDILGDWDTAEDDPSSSPIRLNSWQDYLDDEKKYAESQTQSDENTRMNPDKNMPLDSTSGTIVSANFRTPVPGNYLLNTTPGGSLSNSLSGTMPLSGGTMNNSGSLRLGLKSSSISAAGPSGQKPSSVGRAVRWCDLSKPEKAFLSEMCQPGKGMPPKIPVHEDKHCRFEILTAPNGKVPELNWIIDENGRERAICKNWTEEIEQWVQRQEEFGFDTEWRPECRGEWNGVGLIQLAGTDQKVLLLRTHKMCTDMVSDGIPKVLRDAMKDVNRKKYIFGEDDASRIKKALGITCAGVEVLDNLFSRRVRLTKEPEFADHAKGGNMVGLKKLCSYYDLPILKDKKISKSDWNSPNLSQGQIQYAADDAWFTLMCGLFLLQDLKWLEKQPFVTEINNP